ncbi:MAG: hypothetical protein HDT18_07780 [Oscillibacter sp.]|nr:hypothetical protein [Oscillibacter sp.]
MKSMKRKLLSLLLAMAMILTLVPTALAAGEYSVDISTDTLANTDDGAYLVGTTVSLEATVSDWSAADGDLNYSWSSNATGNGNKATVTSNTAGRVTVTCTASATAANEAGGETTKDGTGSITIEFVEPDPIAVTGVSLNKSELTLVAGSSETLTPTVTPTDAANKEVTWKSSNDAVAEVTSAGKVTAVAAGTATITVKTEDGGYTASCAVTVTAATTARTVTLSEPSRKDIYYSDGTIAGAMNTATVTLTTTGDFAGYELKLRGTNSDAVSIALSASTYTITANSLRTTTEVSIWAEYTNGSTKDTVTSNTIRLKVHPGDEYTLNPTPAATTVNWSSLNLSSTGYQTFSVDPTWVLNGVSQPTDSSRISYQWWLNDKSFGSTDSVRVSASDLAYGQNNELSCTVTFKYAGGSTAHTESAYWTINMGYSTSVLATATVSTSTSSYALGDLDDAGKSSIADQLESYFYNTTRNYYGLVSVRFSNVKDGTNGSLNASTGTDYYADRQGGSNARYLSDVLFYPGSVKTTATFQATFYYYNTRNPQSSSRDISSMTGAITFNVVESASTGDITYNASIGDDVAFAVKDFEDFYYSKTRGNLSYVSFTLPSGGTLYADGGRLNTSNACYAAPGRTQTDLAGVYFSPSGTTASRAGTVRISFTAYGTRSSTSGTVAITYLSGTAKDITYNITTSGSLKASDFTDAYREVVGSAAPTGLTIEFQNVPAYGTLSYKDSSRTSATLVTLRDSNIKSYKFTTRSSGANQLGDVTYTANGSHTDTIEYIAYVNNTPQFTGKVVFNSTNTSAANMQVGFTSTNGQAVTFSYAEFAKANATVIASTSYIRFVTMPTGGTLSYNGSAMTLSSPNVPPASLGSVVYRPNAGFNNSTDRISFLCYDANGNSVGGGQVSIVVTGNASNSAAVTTVNSFKDVSATAWYRDDLITLVAAGIIQGRGDGKFDPTAELTYGEALKIFMLSAGYPKLAETSGKDWAINYKNLAVSNGWISSSVDLSAKISRNAMAELAAKALGVAATSTVPPTWKDGTSNGYANALYYTDPQILIGNADGTFKGTSTLNRQEICKIAARVLTYKSNQQATDTGKPGWLG